MNNLYISYIDHFTPENTAFEQSAAYLSVLLRVTSSFDTVCNIVTRRENHLHEHELQLSDYETSERNPSDQAVCPSSLIEDMVERMKSVSHH